MRYLLDTNIISHAIDFPRGMAAERIRKEVTAGTLLTSIIVVAELRYGYTKISSERLRDAYERFFDSVPIEGWETPYDHVYAAIRDDLQKRGRLIGAMDMLIAAHAVATDAVVVSANEKHFSQVQGLRMENWLR